MHSTLTGVHSRLTRGLSIANKTHHFQCICRSVQFLYLAASARTKILLNKEGACNVSIEIAVLSIYSTHSKYDFSGVVHFKGSPSRTLVQTFINHQGWLIVYVRDDQDSGDATSKHSMLDPTGVNAANYHKGIDFVSNQSRV